MNIEQIILGSIINNNSIMATAMRKIKSTYFTSYDHRDMFAIMVELYTKDKAITYTSVYTTLCIGHAGAGDIIHACIDNATNNFKEFQYCLEVLIENACKKRFSELKDRLINNLRDESIDSNTLYSVVNSTLVEVSKAKYQNDIVSLTECMNDYFELYLKERNGIVQRNISTNIPALDKKLNGGLKTGLYIIGARSSVGKTSFALQLSRNIAQTGRRVVFTSLEMTKNELIDKMLLATIKDDDEKDLFKNRDKEYDWSELTKVVGTPIWDNIYIDDSCSRSIVDITNLIREYNRREKCNVAVIDYLQLIDTTDLNAQTREREIAIATRALKNLSKECDIPIILLCQLNRNVENRGDRKPCMADLRESGAIEQDANVVLLLYKPSQAKIDTYTTYTGNVIDTKNLLVCIVDKNRSGECGEVYLHYNSDMSRIFDNNNYKPDLTPLPNDEDVIPF